MKASRFFIGTLKEAPADAEIVSHKLMVRAGMIRRVAGGIYNYLPIGLRSIRKVEAIVREEMNRGGRYRTADAGRAAGRVVAGVRPLGTIRPRIAALEGPPSSRDFVIGPTHEEVVTDIARGADQELPSVAGQLLPDPDQVPRRNPSAFRRDARPRVHHERRVLVRQGRRPVCASRIARCSTRYVRIFTRLGLEFRAVAADNGSIGGSGSHEFHVIADTGEDAIAYCPTSDFAANVEAAEALPLYAQRAAPAEEMKKTPTPGKAK